MVKHKVDDSSSDEPDLGILLALAYGAFSEELRADLAKAGYADLHRSFGYVARNLAEGELTLTELADRLGMTSPGALKIVQSIEDGGYIERLSDPNDGRARRLRLTRKGRAALAAARDFHGRYERKLVERHGSKAVRDLRVVLAAMVARHESRGAPLFLRPM